MTVFKTNKIMSKWRHDGTNQKHARAVKANLAAGARGAASSAGRDDMRRRGKTATRGLRFARDGRNADDPGADRGKRAWTARGRLLAAAARDATARDQLLIGLRTALFSVLADAANLYR